MAPRKTKAGAPPAVTPPLDAQKWPAAAIVWRKVADLVPYARNARTHSERQVAQIAASMREWGWTIPVLLDERDGIIAGHGRIMAAPLNGIDVVPCMVAAGWSDAKKRAYILADNQLAQNAGWDEELLALELTDIEAEGFDLGLVGFDADALDKLLGTGAGAAGEGAEAAKAKLSEKFMLPPFSVLNAREGWWQDRKRAWIALGIQSELGRGAPTGGSPEPLARAKAGQQSVMKTGRKADAIPGGAGAGAVYRDGGAKMRAQRLDAGKGGALADQMAAGKGTSRAERAARKASPGGSLMPATNYSKTRARGDGRGKAIAEASGLAVPAVVSGAERSPIVEAGGVRLDPYYEAKCRPFLEPGDMLWIVGIRATEVG